MEESLEVAGPGPRSGRPGRLKRAAVAGGRVALLATGLVTMIWFFFSFISIVSGGILLVFDKDGRWKRNGLVISAAGALATLIAHVGTVSSPLNMAMATSFSIAAGSAAAIIAWHVVKRKKKAPRRLENAFARAGKALKGGRGMALSVAIAALPLLAWAPVSVNPALADNSARMLWIMGPSSANQSQPFTFAVQAWDIFERQSATYTGTVNFSIMSYHDNGTAIASPDAILPGPYTFTGQAFGSDLAHYIRDGRDNGAREFTATIGTAGIHYLAATDSVTGLTFYSNPVHVGTFGGGDFKTYWGDPHTHSILSDGSGTPEHAFYHARHVARLDFHALTDHAEIMTFAPGSKDLAERAANAHHAPGEFVTLHGIEWTCVREGHYTLVFSGDTMLKDEINSYLTVTTTDGLWDVLDRFTAATGDEVLAFPHHTTKKSYPQDWSHYNPTYVKLAEVSSVHGDFLYEQRDALNYRGAQDPPPTRQNGTSISDALRMGLRMGLYAASDGHDGRPGHAIGHTGAYHGHQRPLTTWHTRQDKIYPGGLTAVRAMGLTRGEIFDGLKHARVHASSDHGRPLVEFSINGTGVGHGSTLAAPSTSAHRNISVFVALDGSPAAGRQVSAASKVAPGWAPDWDATVEILKNGELLTAINITGPVSTVSFLDTVPITGAVYGADSCIVRGGEYFINEYSNKPVDPATLNTGGADFYIFRLVQGDRMAWAGPIWVEA